MIASDKIREGVVNWFWVEPKKLKSSSLLNNTILRYYGDNYSGIGKPIYDILFPLVRCGVVEYYGRNQFGLSPSCSLKNDGSILLCNVQLHSDSYNSRSEIFNNNLGIQVYEYSSSLLELLHTKSIPTNEFSFMDCLSNFPTIKHLVQNWSDDSSSYRKNYFYFDDKYKWTQNVDCFELGVYRKFREVYSPKVLKTDDKTWKCIPSMEECIDGFSISIIWSIIMGGKELRIQYDRFNGILRIKNIYFPMIIERLLYLNTLLHKKFDLNIKEREYYLSLDEFYKLNELFEHKLEVA